MKRMTNTEYMKKLIKMNICITWKMYKLYCYVNNLKESDYKNLIEWVNG